MLSVQIQIRIAYYRVFFTPKVHGALYTIGGIPTKAYFLHDNLTAVCTVTVILPARITLTDIVVLFILFLSDSGTTEARIPQIFNPLNPELNPICYLLALLGTHHFLHVSRIRVKLLNFRLLMSYIYGASILDVSRSHTTTQHSR